MGSYESSFAPTANLLTSNVASPSDFGQFMHNLAQGPPLGDDPDILVSYSDRENRAAAAN